MVNCTSRITHEHPMASYVVIVDEDGNEIPLVKEYDLDTKEIVLYKIDSSKSKSKNPRLAMLLFDENNKPITETIILPGSKLMFRQSLDRITNGK